MDTTTSTNVNVTVAKDDSTDPDTLYPRNDTYTWGEFAYAAIEVGGYNDVSIVNPYTGARFWVGDVFDDGPQSVATTLRKLADAMDANPDLVATFQN